MDSRSRHDRLVKKIPETLAGLLGIGPDDVETRSGRSIGADYIVSTLGQTFVVEFKISTSAAPVASTVKNLREKTVQFSRKAVPLLAVPFMGEIGRRICEDAGVNWMDLSGNARIIAPGMRVLVGGQINRFRSVGRPPNLFAPKSSRIARWLLIHPETPFTQREIAQATDMDEGFVSRLVSRLEQEGYIDRDKNGAVKPKAPALLLDAWRESYRFSGHALQQGHVAARSGDALLKSVCDTLTAMRIEYAATGLAAAWAFTHFAAFRTATLYLTDDPPQTLLDAIGFHEEERGANLWLAIPNDAGVFQDAVEKDGIRCVHPVQAYLDLKAHPERAAEAAERLRKDFLAWRRDG